MRGISLSLVEKNTKLQMDIDMLLIEGQLDADALKGIIEESDFSHFSILEEDIDDCIDLMQAARNQNSVDMISKIVAVLPPAKLNLSVDDDKMSATLSICLPKGARVPQLSQLITALHKNKITRGISSKRIRRLLNKAVESEPDTLVEDIVAKGLPPRHGKPSRVVPMVPNALERILMPQETDNGKKDMRNLGNVICVTAQTPVAKRCAPTTGRNGFNIIGEVLPTEGGEWLDIKLGANTAISETNENIIMATMNGQPKFKDGVMSVDDTLVTKGVNVKTGNIDYKGSVIVNGDVTEHMQIMATGDVTVNGFVESAMIRAGGDIILTQGASGRVEDVDCQLYASGNIFLQHGQGLDLVAGKSINASKQIAHCEIKCGASLVVGDLENPRGNLFACKIKSGGPVKAGSVGAISGSALEIDFSDEHTKLTERLNALADLLSNLKSTNAVHEIHKSKINFKKLNPELLNKAKLLDARLTEERYLLRWMANTEQCLADAREDYERNIRVLAYNELFPGVVVKLHQKLWKADRELPSARIVLNEDNWDYEPLL